MDKDGLKAFDDLLSRKGDKYLKNFPSSSYEDRISEIIWGVKSKTVNRKDLYSFAIANIKNSKRLLVNGVLTNLNWRDYFDGLLKNPGLMCEYFIVDYLNRNSKEFEKYKNKRFKFYHKKGSPEQDEDLKIDFITTMTTKSVAGRFTSINFGVQLTTSKSKAKYSKKSINGLDWIGRKKGDIYRTTRKIEAGTIEGFPPSYVPHSMCLLVINSSINELINIENINIFKNAFNTWADEGFLPGGPTQYLNNMVKKDLEKINDGYHLGMEIFYKLISSLLLNNRDFKNIKKYDHFDILFEYDNATNELKMDYFLKNGSFLMSLFFIVNDKVVRLINAG